MEFLSPEPKVEIISITDYKGRGPANVAIAGARSCYKGELLMPDSPGNVEGEDQKKWDLLGRKTIHSGHTTPYGHVMINFTIENVSRMLIWSFLHDQPFGNTTQFSQRYAETGDQHVIPNLNDERQEKLFRDTVRIGYDAYLRLTELLISDVSDPYYDRFPKQRKKRKGKSSIERLAREEARYVLAVGNMAHMYYTISSLDLLKHAKYAETNDVPKESRLLVNKMLEKVGKVDSRLVDILRDKDLIDEADSLERKLVDDYGVEYDINKFDAQLNGFRSKLIGYTENPEEILKQQLDNQLGVNIPMDKVIDELLNPFENRYLLDPFKGAYMPKVMKILESVKFKFMKKLSHTADMQNQRHRTIRGGRPLLINQYGGKPDFITPDLISSNKEANELYEKAMHEIFGNINELMDRGVSSEFVSYLLPNSFPVRFFEEAALLWYLFKSKERLCFNSQKEIYLATLDEHRQIQEVHPKIAGYLGAPCHIVDMARQQGARGQGKCPEGTSYCGKKVWKKPIGEIDRII